MIKNDELLTLGKNGMALWTLLRNRAVLSEKNGWKDEKTGYTYVIMKVSEICEKLGVCKRTAASTLNKLEAANLILRRKQGMCRPQRILIIGSYAPYKSNIQYNAEDCNKNIARNSEINGKTAVKDDTVEKFYMEYWDSIEDWYGGAEKPVNTYAVTAEKSGNPSGCPDTGIKSDMQTFSASPEVWDIAPHEVQKTAPQEVQKIALPYNIYKYNNKGCNKYNNNKSYQSYNDDYKFFEEVFYKNIGYENGLCTADPSEQAVISLMAEVTADTLSKKRSTMYVAGAQRTYSDVYRHLMDIDREHVDYITECMKNSSVRVRNPKAYMLACLYNAPDTIDVYYTMQAQNDLNRTKMDI